MTDYKKFLDEGIAEIHKGNFEKGIEKINQSIDLKNDWEIPHFYMEKMTDPYYNRARISLTRKDIQNPDIKKAVEDLEKALELDEKFLDALYAIAAAHKKLGNYQTALNYLDKLIKIEPDAINAKALKKLIQQKYL